MNTQTYPTNKLPGVPDAVEFGDESDSAISEGQAPRGNEGDDAPFTKTYVAIDGVEYTDFSEEEKEEIERALKELTIFEQDKQVTDVRVLGEDTAIMEVDKR